MTGISREFSTWRKSVEREREGGRNGERGKLNLGRELKSTSKRSEIKSTEKARNSANERERERTNWADHIGLAHRNIYNL